MSSLTKNTVLAILDNRFYRNSIGTRNIVHIAKYIKTKKTPEEVFYNAYVLAGRASTS